MSIFSTVLVGTDQSHPSYRTVEQAADIAKKHGARLAIVCSYFPEPPERVNEAHDILRDAAFNVCGSNPAEQTLSVAAERARNRGLSDHDIETTPAQGRLAKSLITQSRRVDADLLVVEHLNPLTKKVVESRVEADLLVGQQHRLSPRTKKTANSAAILRRHARALMPSS